MSEIKFVNLLDLINNNSDKIEIIKHQYLLLLSNLTVTNYIKTELFLKNIKKINEMGSIIVGIITDLNDNFDIIASGTIIIEPKIIREGKNVGHIEDIVVAPNMRGQGLSQKILEVLKDIARENNCYKVILDCSNEIKKVYIKNGFDIKGVQMAEYF
jgi:glucosamine-phosphate N-acetyltransferase